MKNIITTLVLIASLTYSAKADTSPQQYVWAKSGLNVRVAPGTDQKIIEKIPFGDSIMVLSETDITYNITGIKSVDSTQYYMSRYERKAPFILYGNWVEVYTSSGKIGYVVDQYLLPVRPHDGDWLKLEILTTDTITVEEEDYKQRFLHHTYNNNITSSSLINEKYYYETFSFPNMNIQDVFVILSLDGVQLENARVTQNWKDSLRFNDGEICDLVLTQKEGYVELQWSCSC